MSKKLPADFLKLLKSVTAKRPKTVIDHILKHGQITTEELKSKYGYNHPPRAIRDVREQGIPITTFRVPGTDGRSIGAYKFGDPKKVRNTKLSGRTAFSKDLKDKLINAHGKKCNITLKEFPNRELQIDHRIPFEIAGDLKKLSSNIKEYMLVSASANRAKSWSCENCSNWKKKDVNVCMKCYWAYPENYDHIATRQIRRLDIVWSEEEVAEYDAIKKESENSNETLPDYVKSILKDHLDQNN